MTIGNWIEAAVALATFTLAVGTWRMARYTREVATESAAGTRLADLHHQETIRPVLVIDDAAWQQGIGRIMGTLNVYLRNIGSAAALDVKYQFSGQVMARRCELEDKVGHLAAGESKVVSIGTPHQSERWHEPTAWWTLKVTYDDSFGNDGEASVACGASETDNMYDYRLTVPNVRQQVLDEVRPLVLRRPTWRRRLKSVGTT